MTNHPGWVRLNCCICWKETERSFLLNLLWHGGWYDVWLPKRILENARFDISGMFYGWIPWDKFIEIMTESKPYMEKDGGLNGHG